MSVLDGIERANGITWSGNLKFHLTVKKLGHGTAWNGMERHGAGAIGLPLLSCSKDMLAYYLANSSARKNLEAILRNT